VGDELRYSIRFGNRGTALLSAQLAVALPAGLMVDALAAPRRRRDLNLGTLILANQERLLLNDRRPCRR
jgi:hypothetical protein